MSDRAAEGQQQAPGQHPTVRNFERPRGGPHTSCCPRPSVQERVGWRMGVCPAPFWACQTTGQCPRAQDSDPRGSSHSQERCAQGSWSDPLGTLTAGGGPSWST